MKRILIALALIAAALATNRPFDDGVQAAPDAGPAIDDVRVAFGEVPLPYVDDKPNRTVTIEGRGFYGTAFGPFVHFEMDDGSVHEALGVVLESGERIVAWPPRGVEGAVTVIVQNPDRVRVTADVSL